MTLRSLPFVLALAVMTFACEQKMAPADGSGDGDDTAADSDKKDGDDTAAKDTKDTPAKADDTAAKKTDTPAATTTTTAATTPATTTPATTTKTTTPATDDKKADDTDPADIGNCVADSKDPDSFTKCFGSFNPGGFGF